MKRASGCERAALALAVVRCGRRFDRVFQHGEHPAVPRLGSRRRWRPPTDGRTHRYEVVILDRLARASSTWISGSDWSAALSLSRAQWLSAAVPAASDTLRVSDSEHGVVFVTRRGLLGVRILDLRTKRLLYVTRFKGFTWNPRFGPTCRATGSRLAPDRPELWVLDAPNSVVHVFDVSELPGRPPQRLEDIRLSKPISGDENPCQRACGRIGSLLHECGRALRLCRRRGRRDRYAHARDRGQSGGAPQLAMQLEVDWVGGKAVFPARK